MSAQYQKAIDNVEKFLHQPGKINDYGQKIENLTGVKRIYVAQGLAGLFVLYMVFGYFAQLLCNIVGFVYPAYVSIKAVESSSKDDDTRWLTYWVVFALFSVVDFFSSVVLSWFPFYWLAKCIFLIWCYLPVKENGTQYIYSRVIRPYFVKHGVRIEGQFDNLAKKVESTVKDALNKNN